MVAPLDDPLSYPGIRPAESFLLRGANVAPLPDRFRPVGRRPVLAIGSNADPAQLAAKFRGRRCSDLVVGLLVTVVGLQVRPSAHFSRFGYWPFAPVAVDGSPSPAVLCLLDDEQVRVLDGTEPNYVRAQLDPGAHPVLGAPELGPVSVYVSRHGVVDDGRLPPWSEPPPEQELLIRGLLRYLPSLPGIPTSPDPRDLVAAVRARPDLADEITAALKRSLTVRPAGLSLQPDEP
jgi:hypothetical protein